MISLIIAALVAIALAQGACNVTGCLNCLGVSGCVYCSTAMTSVADPNSNCVNATIGCTSTQSASNVTTQCSYDNQKMCTAFTDCGTCSGTSGCGWCNTFSALGASGSCSYVGSDNKCPLGSTPVTSAMCSGSATCGAQLNCTTCMTSAGCGWCNALSYVGATSGGGCEFLGGGTCANALKPVSTCSGDMEKACEAFIDCGACAASSGCGWCNTFSAVGSSGSCSYVGTGKCTLGSTPVTSTMCSGSSMCGAILNCTACSMAMGCGWCNALSKVGATSGGGCEFLGGGTCANALKPVAIGDCGTMHAAAAMATMAIFAVVIALLVAIM